MATQAEIETILKLKDELTTGLKKVSGAVQEVSAKQGVLQKGLADVRTGLADVGSAATGVSPKMLGVAGAVAALGLGVVKAVKDTIALGDELVALNAKTGISIQGLQELKFAAEQNDVSFENLTRAVQMLGQRVASDTPEAVEAIKAIGLSVEQIVQAKPEEAFLLVAERIKQIPDPANQAAVAMAAFGRSGLEVLPGINQNLGESIERFRELDAAMSEETARAAADLNDKMAELNVRWTEIKTAIGSAVIPALLGLLSPIESLKQAWTLFVSAMTLGAAEMVQVFANAAKQAADLQYAMAVVLGDAATKAGDALMNISLGAQEMAESLRDDAAQGFASVTKSADETDKAAKKTDFTFKGLTDSTKKLDEQFKKTSDTMGILAKGMEQFEEIRHYETIEKSAKAWVEEQKQIKEATDALQPYLDKAKERVKQMEGEKVQLQALELKTVDWGSAMDRTNDFLSEARGLFDLLGVSSDSVLGKMLGWATKIFDAFNSITGVIGKVIGLFGGGGGGLGGLFGGLGGGIASLFGGGGAAAGGAAASAAGGAGAAAAGAGGGLGGLGGVLGGLLTNPLTALIGGGIGAFFGLKALFGKKGSAETTADVLGIDFDALSENLQTKLQEIGEQVGDFATGLQMNLGAIFAEGGLGDNFDAMAEKMADTFSFLERGQLNAAQAQQVLNDTVGQMIPVVDQMGAQGVYQLERLFAAAAQTGVSFDGMAELAAQYIQRANELGISVNDVALRALGLDAALAGISTENITAATSAANSLAGALQRAAAAGGGINPDIDIPGFASGGYVPPTPGGRIIRVAEGGEGEHIIPDSKMGSGGGGTSKVEVSINVQSAPGALLDAATRQRLAADLGPVIAEAIRNNYGRTGTEVTRKSR